MRAQAAESWIQSLGGALGMMLGTYMESLGTCKQFMSEVAIATKINGSSLNFYFQPNPVGKKVYSGPKLEIIPGRTNFTYGGACDPLPAVIKPNSSASIIAGDSYWGQASADVTTYFKVYNATGAPTKCTLKLYMNDGRNGLERKPVYYSLTKEGECATSVPNLKINQVKTGCGQRGRSGDCLTDPKTSVNYYSTGFNVYFEGNDPLSPLSSF